MSKVAGIILILLGGAAATLAVQEYLHPGQLSPLARNSTAGIGALLILAGLAHFRAAHKAFLMSIPLLIFFHAQMYVDLIHYFSEPLWFYQAAMGAVSVLILVLSYRGFRKSRESSIAKT